MRNENKKNNNKLKQLDAISLLVAALDVFAVLFAFFLALWLRFDCVFSSIPEEYLYCYCYSIFPHVLITVLIFAFFKLYNSVWKFVVYNEFVRVAVATLLSGIVNIVVAQVIYDFMFGNNDSRMPISYFVFGTIFQFLFCVGIRFSYRIVKNLRKNLDSVSYKPVLIYGAGEAGRILAKDIASESKLGEKVVAFIDDNPEIQNRFVDGVRVAGGREDVLKTVDELNIQKIYVALPSVPKNEIKEILNICTEASCEVFNLPSLYQLISGQVNVTQAKEVQIEDLLGREVIKVNNEEIGRFIEGKVVLITGAGGSIGSELSRQCAANNPKSLILFDVYENDIYDVQLELKKKYPYLDLKVLIGSVRDSRRMFQIFEQYHPQIVYHAAAHKHVPLMEDSPCESIKNNAIGTYKTAFAAMVHGCERFVLISTDKAVNPTNIMGASKRICEMIIQSFDAKIKAGKADELEQIFTHWSLEDKHEDEIKEALRNCKTEFVAVRFGNVLGSNGSVIPIFKRQIEAGGPVTVTHPDIIRYFMTIPEAVSLVLQAGTYAHGGEIFVLDMGEPMKIDTLARNLIKLSGFIPDVDIKVEYTGLRPGEKLYEEKLMAEEGLEKTANDLIFIGKPLEFDYEYFLNNLGELIDVAYKNRDSIKQHVAKIVTTYHPR